MTVEEGFGWERFVLFGGEFGPQVAGEQGKIGGANGKGGEVVVE